MYFSAKLESGFYFSATWNVNCVLINCYQFIIFDVMQRWCFLVDTFLVLYTENMGLAILEGCVDGCCIFPEIESNRAAKLKICPYGFPGKENNQIDNNGITVCKGIKKNGEKSPFRKNQKPTIKKSL